MRWAAYVRSEDRSSRFWHHRARSSRKNFRASCEVLVSDPFVPDETICAARCVPVTTQDLLAQADVVSVHVRLLPATRGMFTKDFSRR
ncbi:MAG: NAD(P)-dependent oxidoreductase [Christensenellales bacterium]